MPEIFPPLDETAGSVLVSGILSGVREEAQGLFKAITDHTSEQMLQRSNERAADQAARVAERDLRHRENPRGHGGGGVAAKNSAPKKFEGHKGEIVTSFMRILETHIRGLGMEGDDESIVAVFHRFVGTKVMTAWNAMPADEQFVWAKVRAKILNCWSPERAAMHAQQTFEDRVQKDDESYRQYMDALLELAKNGWGVDIDKAKVCKQFYKGITDPKVAHQLRFAFQLHPLNVVEQDILVEMTENAANVITNTCGMRSEEKEEDPIPKKSTGNSNSGTAANPQPARRQGFQQRPPRNAPDETAPANPRNFPRRNEYPTDAQWKNQALGLCFGCGQSGHQIRDCKDRFMTKSVEHINKMCEIFGAEEFTRELPPDMDISDAREEITISLIRRMIAGVECFNCGEEGHFSNNCVAENADRMKGERAKERFMAQKKEKEGMDRIGSDKLDRLMEEILRQGRALEVLQKESNRPQGGPEITWTEPPRAATMPRGFVPRVRQPAARYRQPMNRGPAAVYPTPGNHQARGRGIPMHPPPRGVTPVAAINPGYGAYAVQQEGINPEDYPLHFGEPEPSYYEDSWYGYTPVYEHGYCPQPRYSKENGNAEVDKEATITEIKDQGN
jgi:hypothetical protein